MRQMLLNYIRAGYPGIYIVSHEEQRVEAEVKAVADALEMAAVIARRNPDAIGKAKQMLNNSALVSVREGLAEESACSRQLMGTANQLEAVMSTFEKRDPRFTNPE